MTKLLWERAQQHGNVEAHRTRHQRCAFGQSAYEGGHGAVGLRSAQHKPGRGAQQDASNRLVPSCPHEPAAARGVVIVLPELILAARERVDAAHEVARLHALHAARAKRREARAWRCVFRHDALPLRPLLGRWHRATQATQARGELCAAEAGSLGPERGAQVGACDSSLGGRLCSGVAGTGDPAEAADTRDDTWPTALYRMCRCFSQCVYAPHRSLETFHALGEIRS